MDNITITRLSRIHPKLRDDVTKAIQKANSLGLDFRITQGLRTIDEQNALYAQGRTKSGPIVTNAKGGESFHNYGLAIDFCLLHKDGNISFSITEDANQNKKKDWDEIVQVFLDLGWEHGDRGYFDNPHVQKVFGLTPKQCLDKINNKQVDSSGYILI
jgi:peptidoglycan L-alanyl-D-glutamate endopeptidase CwlK